MRSDSSCRSSRRLSWTSRTLDLPYAESTNMTNSGNVADLSTATFTDLADLASARIGGRAIATNDDFFASKSNLVKPEPPQFIPGKYTTRGKWMDGWESRRRRTPGHDWCVVALGVRGVIHGVNVNTAHFTGNFPSHCSIDALDTAKPVTRSLAALARSALDDHPREIAPAGQQRELLRDRRQTAVDARASEHFSRRRRRAPAGARRSRDRLDAARAAAAGASIWPRSPTADACSA